MVCKRERGGGYYKTMHCNSLVWKLKGLGLNFSMFTIYLLTKKPYVYYLVINIALNIIYLLANSVNKKCINSGNEKCFLISLAR